MANISNLLLDNEEVPILAIGIPVCSIVTVVLIAA